MIGETYPKMREQARRRVLMRTGMAAHGLAFVLASVGMLALDLATNGALRWSPFPIGGWSVGLVAHGSAVLYHLSGRFDRSVDRETERLRQSRGW